MLSGIIYQPGDQILPSNIGPQPSNRINPGATLVCVTTNINTACCRAADNNGMTTDKTGSAGEWYYPNGNQVPRPDIEMMKFAIISYAQPVRLTRESSDFTPSLGVYTCVVPDPNTGAL